MRHLWRIQKFQAEIFHKTQAIYEPMSKDNIVVVNGDPENRNIKNSDPLGI